MKPLQRLTYWTLLTIGTHIGHSVSNTYFFTTWIAYLCLKPFDLVFINLFKSVILARTGFLTLSSVCEDKSPIWFVDLDPINRNYEKYAADLCGEFNWQGRWAAGIISNFETFSVLIDCLRNKERVWHNARQRWFVGNLQYWLKSRLSWPRYVFTQSVHTTQFPVREAFYLGIPCFGVVDTNAYSNTVSIAFPGNDDSLVCISFYNELIVNYILKRKFEIILMWFQNILKKDVYRLDEWYEQFIKYYNPKEKEFDFHAHEIFEMNGFGHYKFERKDSCSGLNSDFSYSRFLKKEGILFRKLMSNSDLFIKRYIYRNKSLLIYNLNRYFTKYGWLNKFFKESAKDDTYKRWIRFQRKRKFKESVARYNSTYGADLYFTKYLVYYISNKYSNYKALQSFNISTTGGNYFYFNSLSQYLGYPLVSNNKPYFFFDIRLDGWSRGNLFFKDIKRLFINNSSTKWFESKFIKWFKSIRYNCRSDFISLFNWGSQEHPFENWRVFEKDEYVFILNKVNFILNSFYKYGDYHYRVLIKKMLRGFVFFDTYEEKFFVDIEVLYRIDKILVKYFKNVKDYLIKYIDRSALCQEKKKGKSIYLGRRFIKKYFRFWYFRFGYKGWVFKRRRKWRRFYSSFYRRWHYKRIYKKYNIKSNLLKDVKKSIIFNLGANDFAKEEFNKFILSNRINFSFKIKKLVHLMNKRLKFHFDFYDSLKDKIFNKKELLILLIYINNMFENEDSLVFLFKRLKKNDYKNSLIFTKNLKSYGGIINFIFNDLANLMHFSKGSGFDWTWDEFVEVREAKRIYLKEWLTMRRLEGDMVYPYKVISIDPSNINRNDTVLSIINWRYINNK